MVDLVQQVWSLAVERKKIFLIPLMTMLLLIGGLLILAQGSAVAPFIYALF